jgi:DNA-binding transcriptional MerR regulator
MNRSKRRPEKNSRKTLRVPSRAPDAVAERGLKIGEAAKVIGVEPYVLRFWETQFQILKPKHARSKHRFYQPRDIETLKLIKRLLHEEGFTIAGANKYIRENGIDPSQITQQAPRPAAAESTGHASPASGPMDGITRRTLAEMRRDLQSIHKLLEN